jgi:hypothetical protein
MLPSPIHPITQSLATVALPGLFNQYAEADPELDRADAAARRRANLSRYLALFGGARYVLIGEAAGYAACRFTGVPFTDERQLVGPLPLAWAGQECGFGRTSLTGQPLRREASATVVWTALGRRLDLALWNVVPWHPLGPRGPLSNGLPSRTVQRAGLEVLRLALASVWPTAQPIAVGRVAERALAELELVSPVYLRHPSHGGSSAFRAGLAALGRSD